MNEKLPKIRSVEESNSPISELIITKIEIASLKSISPREHRTEIQCPNIEKSSARQLSGQLPNRYKVSY